MWAAFGVQVKAMSSARAKKGCFQRIVPEFCELKLRTRHKAAESFGWTVKARAQAMACSETPWGPVESEKSVYQYSKLTVQSCEKQN